MVIVYEMKYKEKYKLNTNHRIIFDKIIKSIIAINCFHEEAHV